MRNAAAEREKEIGREGRRERIVRMGQGEREGGQGKDVRGRERGGAHGVGEHEAND